MESNTAVGVCVHDKQQERKCRLSGNSLVA